MVHPHGNDVRPTTPLMVALVGESGSGKTTLANQAAGEGRYRKLRTCTTREPEWRPDGVGGVSMEGGVDYDFVSRERFDELSAAGELLAETTVHGNSYGVPRSEVEGLVAGEVGIAVVDRPGAEELRRRFGALIVKIERSEAARQAALGERFAHNALGGEVENGRLGRNVTREAEATITCGEGGDWLADALRQLDGLVGRRLTRSGSESDRNMTGERDGIGRSGI